MDGAMNREYAEYLQRQVEQHLLQEIHQLMEKNTRLELQLSRMRSRKQLYQAFYLLHTAEDRLSIAETVHKFFPSTRLEVEIRRIRRWVTALRPLLFLLLGARFKP